MIFDEIFNYFIGEFCHVIPVNHKNSHLLICMYCIHFYIIYVILVFLRYCYNFDQYFDLVYFYILCFY